MKRLSCEAEYAINRLKKHGFEAYVVGGYVRDMLSGVAATDVDIASNALPEDVKSAFSDCKVIETGIKHATVTVIINGKPVEITTYRKESVYSDNRHPDKVEYCTDISEDLVRRDFTVNAMAYNHENGLIDLYGGKSDMENKIIRCVGDPVTRFKEDALRILRAMRFSCVLGFEIESSTAKAMHDCKELLVGLSSERISSELTKILCGKNIYRTLIDYADIFCVIIPELENMLHFDQHNYHHIYDIYEHTAVVVSSICAEKHLRLAALLHDCGKPYCFSLDEAGTGHFYSHASKSADTASKILHRLRFDNDTIAKVEKLIRLHDTPINADALTVKKKLNKLGADMLYDLIELQRADTKGLAPEFFDRLKKFDLLRSITEQIIEENSCLSVKDLCVNGYDMMEHGIKGRNTGIALNFLVDAVIEGRVENDKESLLEYLEKNFMP